MLRALLGQRVVAYHPVLSKVMGRASYGIWLSQILYWDNIKAGGWFYKSARDIIGETGITEREAKTAKVEAVKLGIVDVEVKGLPRVTHYLVNYDVLSTLIERSLTLREEVTNKLDTVVQLGDTTPSNSSVQSPSQNRPHITHKITTKNNDDIDIYKLYESNIGLLTPLIEEALKNLEDEYDPVMIKDALEIACERGAKNLRYIQVILSNSKSQGYVSKFRDGKEVNSKRLGEDPEKYIKGKYGHMVQR